MGKGGDGGTDKIIQQQEKQAEEARAKEAKRQARIAEGRQKIKEAFEGRKAVAAGTKTFDWNAALKGIDPSTFKVGAEAGHGLPKGYTMVQIPGTAGVAAVPGKTTTTPLSAASTPFNMKASTPAERRAFLQRGVPNSGNEHGAGSQNRPGAYSTNGAGFYGNEGNEHGAMGSPNNRQTNRGTPAIAGTPATWGIKGPDGKIYKQGDEIKWATPGVAGTSGIDPLYDKYRNAYVSSFMPQVAKQYGDAKKQTTFDLARAGTLKSSMAIDAATDLAEQNRLNNADVITKADQGVGQLKQQVADERLKAENQLMATEDPNVAANTALSAVRNIGLAAPPSTPLGDVFKVALIGGANAITGYKNQSSINDTNNLWRQYGGNTSVIGKK